MNAVTCQNLSKSYGHTTALDGLSCTIGADALTGLIGPNGAGKTTLLKCIAGFYRTTGGTIRVFGQEPFGNLAVSAATILVDESMRFAEGRSLAQLLTIAAPYYPNWDQQLAERLLDYFKLSSRKLPQQLSKGMMSTFRSIIGLCAHASLTLLDEPTTGMDAGVRHDFYRALLKDYLAHPRTIVISSHLLNEFEDILEDILLIDHGQTVLSSSVEALGQYAVRLQGPAEAASPFLRQRTVLHQEQSSLGYICAAVVNDFTADEHEALAAAGLSLGAVSASDVCIYLTNNRPQGGIDHVFA